MAYESFRGSQPPYEQGTFKNTNAYPPPQFHNAPPQPPYQEGYDGMDVNRFPPQPPPPHMNAQPPPIPHSPIPQTPLMRASPRVPEQFVEPPRYYPNNGSSQPQPPPPPAPEGPGPALGSVPVPGPNYSQIPPEVIAQITASVVQQLQGFNLAGNAPRNAPSQAPQNPDGPPFSPPISEVSTAPTANKIYTPPSPFRQGQDVPYQFSNLHYAQTFNEEQAEQDRISRTFGMPQEQPRPKLSRISTENETPVEKTWGLLFDKAGVPTPRLGQFLRGIAVYLMKSYSPENSMVVTPEKLQKFYTDMAVPNDPYPWNDIFNDEISSISRFYREVQVEHHLIQKPDKLWERPDIPGMTPSGFERWMTLMIVAHPEREFQRLLKTVIDMPISNPDDSKERFPKEIPRRLFPKTPDPKVKDLLEQAILQCGVALPKSEKDELQSNPRSRRPTASYGTSPRSDPRLGSSYEEDDDDEEEDEDEDELPPSRPIERERAPYSARPGKGRTREDKPKATFSTPVETKYREHGSRDRLQSPAPSSKRSSKDFNGRDADHGRTPVSARFRDDEFRYREHVREKDKKDDRSRDYRESDKDKYSDQHSREGWDTDEEYYRDSSAVGGRSGRHTQGFDDGKGPFAFR